MVATSLVMVEKLVDKFNGKNGDGGDLLGDSGKIGGKNYGKIDGTIGDGGDLLGDGGDLIGDVFCTF